MMPKSESLFADIRPERERIKAGVGGYMNQENKIAPADIIKTHFDLYTRYFLIARLTDQVRIKTPMRILDAGGGGGLLRSLLKKDKIVVMDTLASSPDYVLGDITHAPFESQSFDLVISTDVYEHIQPAKRAEAISEMLRLSKNFAILGAPFYSSEVEKAEVTANNFWLKATGEPHRWLREHIENKLPHENELESLMKKSGYEFYKFGTNNLFMWLILMLFSFHAERCQIPQDKLGEVWRFYNDNFADLGDFEEPTYRKIYLIGNRGTLPKLSLYKDRRIDRLKQHRLTSLVFETILETSAQRISHIAELETSLQEKVSQIHSMESQIHSMESQIQQIQRSIPMQLVNRYQRIVERLLRRGTRRRRYYELGLTGIRVILTEGWRSFFRKVKARLLAGRGRASKQP
jgi:ubiquinone/menaquinone biosynthesis C-methylase UbiE/flagellin-specific chaperone FliS